MRTIDDILTELTASDSIDAKERFNEKLRGYLFEKYKSTDEAAAYKKFHRDYDVFLAELDSIRRPEERMSKVNRDLRARNNAANWLSADKIPKRESIIDIAFILADSKKRNGEEIANELLKSMGYPKLHGSSEIEIFYGYALRNGLSYAECLSLIDEYNSRKPRNTPPAPIKKRLGRPKKQDKADSDKLSPKPFGVGETSSYYHKKQEIISDKEALFDHLDSNSVSFGIGSRKIAQRVSETFDNMLKEYKHKKDVKLAFFLYYSSDKSVSEFLREFKESGNTTAETARLAYDRYIKARYKLFNFYPINNWSYSNISDCINNTVNGDEIMTRECLLLWLLFYYAPNADPMYFRLDDVNDFIGSRFLRLDERYFFDRFVLTVLGFSIDGDTVKYNGEPICDDPRLCGDNIHALRKSVIRCIFNAGAFNSDYAADDLTATKKSTTYKKDKA